MIFSKDQKLCDDIGFNLYTIGAYLKYYKIDGVIWFSDWDNTIYRRLHPI